MSGALKAAFSSQQLLTSSLVGQLSANMPRVSPTAITEQTTKADKLLDHSEVASFTTTAAWAAAALVNAKENSRGTTETPMTRKFSLTRSIPLIFSNSSKKAAPCKTTTSLPNSEKESSRKLSSVTDLCTEDGTESPTSNKQLVANLVRLKRMRGDKTDYSKSRNGPKSLTVKRRERLKRRQQLLDEQERSELIGVEVINLAPESDGGGKSTRTNIMNDVYVQKKIVNNFVDIAEERRLTRDSMNQHSESTITTVLTTDILDEERENPHPEKEDLEEKPSIISTAKPAKFSRTNSGYLPGRMKSVEEDGSQPGKKESLIHQEEHLAPGPEKKDEKQNSKDQLMKRKAVRKDSDEDNWVPESIKHLINQNQRSANATVTTKTWSKSHVSDDRSCQRSTTQHQRQDKIVQKQGLFNLDSDPWETDKVFREKALGKPSFEKFMEWLSDTGTNGRTTDVKKILFGDDDSD